MIPDKRNEVKAACVEKGGGGTSFPLCEVPSVGCLLSLL